MQRNFLFNYDLENKSVYGVNLPLQDVFKIKVLEPSKQYADEVKTGWIKFINNKYSKRELRNANPGKWILQFPNGNKKLDIAWGRLVDGVVSGDLWEIKVSALNHAHNSNQFIYVYTKDKNDYHDVARVYQYLVDNGIVDLHMSERINKEVCYKTDSQTTRSVMNGTDDTTYTHHDIELMQANRNKLQTIMDKIQQHKYVLHGSRTRLPDGRACSKSVGKIAKDLSSFLDKNPDLISSKEFNTVANTIAKELKDKRTATSGSWFFSLGARDDTTAQLHNEILDICGSTNHRFKKPVASSETSYISRGIKK